MSEEVIVSMYRSVRSMYNIMLYVLRFYKFETSRVFAELPVYVSFATAGVLCSTFAACAATGSAHGRLISQSNSPFEQKYGPSTVHSSHTRKSRRVTHSLVVQRVGPGSLKLVRSLPLLTYRLVCSVRDKVNIGVLRT